MVVGNAAAAAALGPADLLVVPAKLERRPSDKSNSPKSNSSGTPKRSGSRGSNGSKKSRDKHESPKNIQAREFNLDMEFDSTPVVAGPLNPQNSEIVIPTAPLKKNDHPH